MRLIKSLILSSFMLAALSAVCRPPDNWRTLPPAPQTNPNQVSYRDNCNQASAQTDLSINNVRARLLNGGDLWWDLKNGKYIVPKVQPGQVEVSSLYAGAVWIGGVDDAGNLKMACQTYRSQSENDFWPGPLSPTDGSISQGTCKQWDKFFRVLGVNIRKHKANAKFHKLRNEPYPPEEIPKDVKGWPARGNAFFQEIHTFDLPDTKQGLGLFFDTDGDTNYEPEDGDFPVIDIRGCEPKEFPDEMIFWIYNDNGNIHTQSKAEAIRMEVQVQAFGYATQDELNDMTFYRYKLINRAAKAIDSCFFAMWVDPDLGCSEDDFIGCDTVFVKTDTCTFFNDDDSLITKYSPRRRDLMFVYNKDQADGVTGCVCPVNSGNTPTYCNEVPILGVDYFRGPLDEDGCELGMSSFVYWNAANPNPAMTDPSGSIEFYRYLTGYWKDGTPFTSGGSGYNLGSTNVTKFAFGSPPNDPNGWSMCAAIQPQADQRTLQASGPFRLDPGLTNELIIGVPWVPNIQYPCPDLEPLLYADRLAQGLFDNCFDILDGPDAPSLDWVELNREVICVLSNDITSNNYKEEYAEVDFLAPSNFPLSDREFKFEGYKVYQLASPNTSVSELDDIEKSRIVFQCDVRNNIKKIFNWAPTENPFGDPIWAPTEQINGNNKGVAHSFSAKEDQFASGTGRGLVNHKKYYYLAVAYGYNNFENFDPISRLGQRRAYLEGRLNVEIYTVIPRPIVDRALQANYGDGPEITRLEGVGLGGLSVELKPGERERILDPNFNGELTYLEGRGPLNIRIYDPLNVKDGEFELSIIDNNLNDTILDATARWIIKDPIGNVIESERTLARLNEQLIADYGFSVSVAQTLDAGSLIDDQNGGIDQTVTFADPNNQWLSALKNSPDPIPNTGGATPFAFVGNQLLQPYNLIDPKQGLSNIGVEWFTPYMLTWNPKPSTGFDFKISPRWSPNNYSLSSSTNNNTSLKDLNNVDIVFTKDKSKWSRCMVVETASYNYTNIDATSLGYRTESDTLSLPVTSRWLRASMDTRYQFSVGKEDANNDGFPDFDGEIEPATLPDFTGKILPNTLAGKPVRGMGWFPGYAIDVESGERLNIFFGENSIYNGIANGGQVWPNYNGVAAEPKNGADMMFNPSDYAANRAASTYSPYLFVLGGQHFVYVTRTKYDGCDRFRYHMEPDRWTSTAKKTLEKIKTFPLVTWTGVMLLDQGAKMNSYADGLVPNDCTVRLRVDNPYGYKKTTSNGYPRYRFKIAGKAAAALDEIAIANSLDSIKMVPNPYYGYSNYETSQFTTVVKISNLPAKCTVTIYSLDGKFIRQYQRNELPSTDPERTNTPVPNRQILPDIEWDMKNSKAVPVASGVYLVHIDAPGYGQRTLKWFGIGREFDPSGL